MNLKERYRRFRAWQLNPFDYKNHSEHTVLCANCGTEFSANFCPICGQKAGVGPISWQTVRKGIMLVWGIDNRSLGYSLVQLILRPGYLISDYISGKRQASFPPVKMLLIVSIAMIFLDKLFDTGADETTIENAAWDTFLNWVDNNPGWGMLIISCVFVLPTWLFFRYAPKHTRHTLPQGFFIQVFMSTLFIITSILETIFKGFFVWNLIPIFYLIAYRQLFGYSWWGTLWRTSLCMIIGTLSIVLAIFCADLFTNPNPKTLRNVIVTAIVLIFFTFIGVLIEFYNGKKKKDEIMKHRDK